MFLNLQNQNNFNSNLILMTMFFNKKILLVVFFGTLIGLNETLIGSFSMPYRSVILSSITIAILSLARLKIPKIGTSIFVISIAILFKINSIGLSSCSPNVLLCGPTALLLLGVGHELFASLLILKNKLIYKNYLLTCIFTSIFTFSTFALMNTFILGVWNTSRLFEYILLKGLLTAILSSAISLFGLYLFNFVKDKSLLKLNPILVNSLISFIVITLWLFGTFAEL